MDQECDPLKPPQPISEAVTAPDNETLLSPAQFLRQQNAATEAAMAAQGGGLNPLVRLQLRIDAMLKCLFPPGSIMREVYEVTYEQDLAQVLELAQQERVRAQLTAGVPLLDGAS